MEFQTVNYWDEDIWKEWRKVYQEAFGDKNAKKEQIIRNMFHKEMSFFHIAYHKGKVVAIGLSGKIEGTKLLVIDYLAVIKRERSNGIGQHMVDYIVGWAKEKGSFEGIIIEVEAENKKENEERIQFWEKCGFKQTSYIHDYKVVPEPYKAMYVELVPYIKWPEKEEKFFRWLGAFHKKCFQGN